jgi:hypothetical protein
MKVLVLEFYHMIFVVLGFNSFEQRKQGNVANKEIATLKTANQ